MKPKVKKTQLKHFTRSEEERFRKSVEEGSDPRDKLNPMASGEIRLLPE